MQIILLVVYWLVVSIPLKNMKVSWDDYSKIYGNTKKMFQTTNQYILSYSHSIPVLVSLKPLFLRGPWGNHPVTQLNCQHHCKIAAPGRESPQTEKRKTTRCYQWEHTHKIWPYMVQYLHFRILE